MSNNTPNTGEFCWNELKTTDPNKAKAFYSELFGWQVNEMNMGEMTYTMFLQNDKELCGMVEMPKDASMPPHWMSYIMVDDINTMAEKAEQLGAKIISPIQQVGEMGKLVLLEDPTGASISLWEKL